MKLSKLISNMENVRDNLVTLTLPQINYIFSRILVEMAKHTVYDTNQARAGIVKAFSEAFGINVDEVKEVPLNYWQPNKPRRNWNWADTSLTKNISGKKYNVDIMTNDIVLYLYETGNFNISESPPRDNSYFLISPIARISEVIKYGNVDVVPDLREALDELARQVIVEIVR